MPRPSRIWLWFGLSLGLVGLALSVVTVLVGRLEQREWRARQVADREQRFRLALWRLDAAIAVVIATENARPPADYLAPSPLEAGPVSPVRFHFLLRDGGQLTSPTPNPAELARLQQLLDQPLPREDLKSADGTSRTSGTSDLRPRAAVRFANSYLLEDAAADPSSGWFNGMKSSSPTNSRRMEPPLGKVDPGQQEAAARVWNLAQLRNQQMHPPDPAGRSFSGANQLRRAVTAGIQEVGPLAPVWVGEALFLVRRVHRAAGEDWIQGVWLAWPEWSQELAAQVSDLLPSPMLQPIRGDLTGGEDRRLVGLPLRLDAGATELPRWDEGMSHRGWTPTRMALVLAWAAMLAAAAAVAWLLYGSLQLSERRAAFVSAVTHELRTPLTTFQLYSEMLADDMVPDAGRRRSYLEVLRAESVRLGHLVENVLAYSRLERGRTQRPRETITVAALLARIRERLDQRLAQADMTWVMLPEPGTRESPRVVVDVGLMEQVWFNLVDNACKYAGPKASTAPLSRQLEVSVVALPRRRVGLRLRDHGPGFPPEMRRQLFEPFSKSAEQAAGRVPGVGLGLSLCRQLMRSQGGDLILESTGSDGSVFCIQLPRA